MGKGLGQKSDRRFDLPLGKSGRRFFVGFSELRGGVHVHNDILVRREDLPAVKATLEAVGFVHRHDKLFEIFLDGPDAKERDAIHVFFVGEKIRADDLAITPAMTEIEAGKAFSVVSLDALVRMKLTAHRLKDRVHVRDMIDVGLIDATWPAKYPSELGQRLQALLDDPDG